MVSHARRTTANDQRLAHRRNDCRVAIAVALADGATGTSNQNGPTPTLVRRREASRVATRKRSSHNPPVALADFFGWVPLGNMGPPAHTFPTDHQYIYVNDPSSPAPRREVNIVAPSDIIITKAHSQTVTPGSSDYTLEFSPCAEVYAQFGHVLTIAPAILEPGSARSISTATRTRRHLAPASRPARRNSSRSR